jgi:hypothetical protein
MPSLDDPRRCNGTVRNGENKGKRCPNWALLGTTVCRYHGGGAPQVRAKAQERLLLNAVHAAGYMVTAIKRKDGRKLIIDGVGLAAADKILNRVLGIPGQTVTVQGDGGGPVRVVHVYAQLPDAKALALPAAVDAIDVQVIEGGESGAELAGVPARDELIESPMKRRIAF